MPRLVQLLAEWTETFPYDFRDERVMGHVRSITQKVAAVDAAARQEVSALLQNLLLRLTALERYEEGLARLATESTAEQLTQVSFSSSYFPSYEIHRQSTKLQENFTFTSVCVFTSLLQRYDTLFEFSTFLKFVIKFYFRKNIL